MSVAPTVVHTNSLTEHLTIKHKFVWSLLVHYHRLFDRYTTRNMNRGLGRKEKGEDGGGGSGER